MEIDVVKPITPTIRKTSSRRHSSSSSTGSLRISRDVVQHGSPAPGSIMRSSYHEMSPMTPMTPTTPTNNNNNISKYPTLSDQGHFLYPSPGDYGARYSYASNQASVMPAMNNASSFAAIHPSASASDVGIAMGDFDMTSSYSSTDCAGYAHVRSKTNMADSNYAVMNAANNMAYDYRGISPMTMDHMKHYTQYPLTERGYPSTYVYPPVNMTSSGMYPLSAVSGGTSDRYYPDVLEEFVDMQAAMHHGIPSRTMRSDYSYTPAILSN